MTTKNKTETLQKVYKIYELYENRTIPRLAQHEVRPLLDTSSRENYLYFTMAPCLNFQRSSPALWISALQTYEDPDTRYLFFPEKVVANSREKVQADLRKHKLSIQPNKHTDIWIQISKTLHDNFDSDPRELLQKCNYDVSEILMLIQTTMKKDFPYLSGPKMANYWLYILSLYTDANFKNMGSISIIPDTHILQASKHLGISQDSDSPVQVAALWKELLEGSELTPVQMHPALWNWSRNKFLPEV